MLYYSIIFLVIFILIIIYLYNYLGFEKFAQSSGYVETPGAYKKLTKKLADSEIEYGEQADTIAKNAEDLKNNLKNLEQNLLEISNPVGIPDYLKNASPETKLTVKFFDNKELYSILINGLNMKTYNPKENLQDAFGLGGVNYKDDKTIFTRAVTEAINVSCELLQQKQDYRYVSKCVNTVKGIDGAAKIHNLLIKAYKYTTLPKYTSNRTIDPYLVNKLNKNIKKIITVGRRIFLVESNICKCKSEQDITLLQNTLRGFIEMDINIQGQILSIEATLNASRMTVPAFMSNLPGFNIPEPAAFNTKLIDNLKLLYQQKAELGGRIIQIKKTIGDAQKTTAGECQPC